MDMLNCHLNVYVYNHRLVLSLTFIKERQREIERKCVWGCVWLLAVNKEPLEVLKSRKSELLLLRALPYKGTHNIPARLR